MEKKMAGLLGAVAALSTLTTAQAARHPRCLQTPCKPTPTLTCCDQFRMRQKSLRSSMSVSPLLRKRTSSSLSIIITIIIITATTAADPWS